MGEGSDSLKAEGGIPKKNHFRSPHPDVGGDVEGGFLGELFGKFLRLYGCFWRRRRDF